MSFRLHCKVKIQVSLSVLVLVEISGSQPFSTPASPVVKPRQLLQNLGGAVFSCPSLMYEVTHVFIVVHIKTFQKSLGVKSKILYIFLQSPSKFGLDPQKVNIFANIEKIIILSLRFAL